MFSAVIDSFRLIIIIIIININIFLFHEGCLKVTCLKLRASGCILKEDAYIYDIYVINLKKEILPYILHILCHIIALTFHNISLPYHEMPLKSKVQ